MHALARDPFFRPESAAAFAHELAEASEPPTEPLLPNARTEPLRSRAQRSAPGRRAWFWIAGAAAVAIVGVIFGLFSIGGGAGSSAKHQSVQIQAPARGATPADEARNLSAWLRQHSR